MAHPCPVQQPVVTNPKAEVLFSIGQWLNDADGQYDTDWRNAVKLSTDNRKSRACSPPRPAKNGIEAPPHRLVTIRRP